LSVTFFLFVVFWILGAGIFMATEKWAFGKSFYFCWMSFSTIGYGNFSPTSPAGRAIFVVWALMGVATMTILIAVISEAYTSRYNSALQKSAYRKAITNFEEKHHDEHVEEAEEHTPARSLDHAEETAEEELYEAKDFTPSGLAQKILDSSHHHLDPIPMDVIKNAKIFRDHVRYFAGHPMHPREPPPPTLSQLLDEMAEAEKMDDRMKQEMLSDEEARKALFFMSYERAFRNLLDTAERAVEIIATKDAEWEHLVNALKEQEQERAINASASKRGRSSEPARTSVESKRPAESTKGSIRSRASKKNPGDEERDVDAYFAKRQ